MSVAEIIYNQLGGRRFVAMTGARNFVSDKNMLRMQLGRNASKANRLEITLNGLDLYDMRFYRFTDMRISTKNGEFKMYPEKVTEIKKYNNVTCDQLQELFTEVTGLYTRL